MILLITLFRLSKKGGGSHSQFVDAKN